MTFLNMDYSLFKQFTYQVDTPYYPYIKYITEVLFDNDSTDIEFLIRYFDQASSHNYIKILDENGNLLFYRDSAAVDLNFAWGATPNLLNEYSITNTDSGAIMILVMDEDLSNRKREIYKLPGYMQCSVCYDPLYKYLPIIGNPDVITKTDNYLNPFPNPSNDKTTIDYQLPAQYQQGTMKIIDMKGNIVRTYKISQHAKSIIVEKGELAAGMYNCVVEAGDQMVSKKFIRIK